MTDNHQEGMGGSGMSDDELLHALRNSKGWPTLGKAAADRIEELEEELYLMKTAGIIEVSVRNPSVMEYMKHWEGRAETAEAKLAKHDALMQAGFGEYERRLAKAVEALDEAVYLLDPDDEDIAKETGLHRIVTTLAELKGEDRK